MASWKPVPVSEVASEGGVADVVVAGAGAVGLTLALDLAERGQRVVLLEAGPAFVSNDSQKVFAQATWTGHPLEGLHLGRFRALGGTTNFWGGQVVPFERTVFAARPWVGEDGWPIALADIQPYYVKAFAMLGMAHQKGDHDVWRTLGVAPPPQGEGLEFFLTRWVPEPNLARGLAQRIQACPNLRVCVDAAVTALTCDATGASISEVVVRGEQDGQTFRFAGKRVVLANGTVEISRLLKLPLSDGRAAPWADNVWLGRGFADHIDFRVGDVYPIDEKRFHDLFDNALLEGIKYTPKIRIDDAAQIEKQSVSVACHFEFNSSVSDHLASAKTFVKGLLRGRLDGTGRFGISEFIALWSFALPMMARYLRYRRIHNPADAGIKLRITSEQKPVFQSGVDLKEERDALGMPIVNVNWQIDGGEMKDVAAFSIRVKDFLEANNLARVTLDPALLEDPEGFVSTVDDANHHMGGARMARTADRGVVDADLKVFGTNNLYVAGAAVYPTTGFANPTFTAIALGLRLSDHLGATG